MMNNIIVVGASSGLGRLIAVNYASKGFRVGIAARNEGALKQLKETFPGNIDYEVIDITDGTAVGKLNSLIDKIGGMDVYIHVSGILVENLFLNPEAELKTVETNVTGFTRMIDAAFEYFSRTCKKGQIAAITSVAGTKGIGELPAYSSSKRFQWTYIQALEQLADKQKLDISFTDIRPGWTRTPLIDPSRKYMMSMNPEKVANLAVKAIDSKKRVAYIDYRWDILHFFWNLLPGKLWKKVRFKISG